VRYQKIWWILAFLVSFFYLINPGWGVFEFIPDNIPLIGNIDETVATLILLRSLIELGLIRKESVEWLLNLKDNYEEKILGRKPKQKEKQKTNAGKE
jgi:uncharacterized membrane protein YkvA (DUF1232 family)